LSPSCRCAASDRPRQAARRRRATEASHARPRRHIDTQTTTHKKITTAREEGTKPQESHDTQRTRNYANGTAKKVRKKQSTREKPNTHSQTKRIQLEATHARRPQKQTMTTDPQNRDRATQNKRRDEGHQET